jgi:hypothetical protein
MDEGGFSCRPYAQRMGSQPPAASGGLGNCEGDLRVRIPYTRQADRWQRHRTGPIARAWLEYALKDGRGNRIGRQPIDAHVAAVLQANLVLR